MNKLELKKLIRECVQEAISEQDLDEGWFTDKMKTVGKALGVTSGGQDSGAAHYDRFSKMHDKRADYKTAFDPKNPGKGGGKQSQMRASAKKNITDIKTKFEADVKKMLRNAYIEGESVGMNREDITKAFRSALTGIFNKYKHLEEVADE